MITDEERRNVAANIRNAANRRKDDLQDDPDYSPFAALYAVFCGVRGFPRYKDLLHLADLIDRPTCTNQGDDWTFLCSNCGECVTITKEIPCGGAEAPYRPYYCPGCGAEVVEDD